MEFSGREAGGSESFDKFLDEVIAFAHGLAAEGTEPAGDIAEVGAEGIAVSVFQQGKVAVERLDEFLEESAAFGGGEDDVGVEFGVLTEEASDHAEFEPVDGAGEFQATGEVDVLVPEEVTEGEGGEVAEGLDEGHEPVMFLGVDGEDDVAPCGELVEEPLAGLGFTAGCGDDDLLVHAGGGGSEEWVEADDGAGVVLEHGGEGVGLDAGEVGENTVAGEVGGELLCDFGGMGDGY